MRTAKGSCIRSPVSEPDWSAPFFKLRACATWMYFAAQQVGEPAEGLFSHHRAQLSTLAPASD